MTVATPASVLPSVAGAAPTLMTEPLAESDNGIVSLRAFDYGRFANIAAGKSVLAIGPGLSTHPDTVEFTRRVVREFRAFPLVVDADGLNAFAGEAGLLQGEGCKLILTPHPGEMARLTGLSTAEVQARRVELVRELATRQKVYVVLKGYRTLVAEPEGQVYVNPHRESRHGHRRHGRRADRDDCGACWRNIQTCLWRRCLRLPSTGTGRQATLAASRRGEVSLVATDIIEALLSSAENSGDPRPASRRRAPMR